MLTASISKIAGAAALAMTVALGGCITPAAGAGNPLAYGPVQPQLPTFTVTTHTGSAEQVQTSFTPGLAQPGAVRVCLNNQRPGQRSIDLNLSGVNPLNANGRNQQSCASVGAHEVVNLLAMAGNQPAHISPGTVNLAQYDGGLLTFIWR